jgi:cyclophilin family peptidyl-prolyl cis-trans isomerase/HEAT repeat protein
MYRTLLLILCTVVFISCTKEKSGNIFNRDEAFIKITNLQDRRASDSLLVFFSDENSEIRARAVLAFASVQDSTVVGKLSSVLTSDADTTVRIAAATALGQTRCRESENVLKDAIGKEEADNVRGAAIEAYGKVTRNWDLSVDVSKNAPAVAWSLYRASVNNAVDASKNSTGASLLELKQADKTRLGAAHFFSRGAKDIGNQFSAIAKSALEDKNVDVRMASAAALRKIVTDSSFFTLEKIFTNDQDYRVRISAVRGFQAFPFDRSKNYLLKAARDKNVNVAIAASEAIRAIITEAFWIDVANLASESKNWRVQATLYEAVLKVKENNKSVINEVMTLYKTAHPYQKRALLSALQHQLAASTFVEEELLKSTDLVLKTAAAEAYVALNRNKSFSQSNKKHFAEVYEKAIADGDPGVIATVAAALADSTLAYRGTITDYKFLTSARQKLVPIKDDDAIAALDRAMAYFENRKPEKRGSSAYNHPVNWSRIKDLSPDQTVTVFTTKGKIKMRLLVEDAPGSVANFLDLVANNYFDNHYFHRVVPNFVVQVGDKRGDGSGGENYSIRSEFTRTKYKTGSVGMASSGKDTEGTQWFITHSPTPHLDGRYSIFGEVIEGIEAVHGIEIGDQITKIEIDKVVAK